ncbi:GNAT family N-acetyltransferase [Vibrio sinaloensis]|uniref:GNAT family N-acetyltransferase n=1 Tax=Photobacterium sp. (strain ATCC 43367) TaxID=379097 RepID=UPI00204DDF44|nr:GNAT family N-acetyltransferase [Vibrio sinaloensis]UPQ88951.1 GNAT family N-acetyltransferase [Vibrio sinaloensis]
MIETARLRLRQWRDCDLQAYGRINADKRVMRYFPACLSQHESNQQAQTIAAHIEQHGWGFWALELKQTGEFIGFVGLWPQAKESGLPRAPMVEIGWRIDADHWGQGYAPEAAQAALSYGFNQVELEQIYSFTALSNLPSQRVMSKIGMQNTDEVFDHPKLPQGHPLQRHCLYCITRQQWQTAPAAAR